MYMYVVLCVRERICLLACICLLKSSPDFYSCELLQRAAFAFVGQSVVLLPTVPDVVFADPQVWLVGLAAPDSASVN